MNLQFAMEAAACCGLKTLGEAVRNVGIHCLNFVSYSELDRELSELECELVELDEIFPDGWSDVEVPAYIVKEENRKIDEYFRKEEASHTEEVIKIECN